MKIFLLSIFMLSALTNLCSWGTFPRFRQEQLLYMSLQKFRGGGKTHYRIIFLIQGGGQCPPCPTSSGPHALIITVKFINHHQPNSNKQMSLSNMLYKNNLKKYSMAKERFEFLTACPLICKIIDKHNYLLFLILKYSISKKTSARSILLYKVFTKVKTPETLCNRLIQSMQN